MSRESSRGLLRPYTLAYLYRRRLRVHAVQELFAGLGIAIAVALVFATIVSESSIAGSSREVVRAVAGPASLQVRGRGGTGFPEAVLHRVEHLPDVRLAAPLLEQPATLRTASGRHVAIDLAGTDTSLAVLDGLGETLPLAALRPGTIGLAKASAQQLGISGPARQGAGTEVGAGAAVGGTGWVRMQMRGGASTLKVSAVLGQEAVGALAHALVAVMPIERMQELAGMPGQITRIFVEPQPGAQARVAAELRVVAGTRLQVAPADQDVSQLQQALGPSRLASGLFAAIGALLGFLLAFNAMLLTVPERRQAIAELRLSGARRAAIVEMVLFEAVCLGACASLIGLAAGYGLSVGVFHQSSAYLAEAFTLGSSTVLSAKALAIAFGGGVLATCVASLVVLGDLRAGRARDAVYRHEGEAGDALGPTAQRRLLAGSLGLLAAAGALYALVPAAAIAATALLALGTVLAVPVVFACVLRVARTVSEQGERLVSLPVALSSLRTTSLRSLALAATGAVALFGSVALGGSRENLLQGIGRFAHSYVAGAQVWVTNPGDNQTVNELDPRTAAAAARRIARVPGVAGVQAFHGSFLTLESHPPRRVWTIARPPGAVRAVLENEIQQGRARVAEQRLSEGGWIVVSKQIAEEQKTGVGGALTLATPTGPARLRIAATTTNLAWPPGVIFFSPSDYTRLWGGLAPASPSAPGPSALGVTLKQGIDPTLARARIAGVLNATGAGSGVEVATQRQREASIDALTGEGLGQLREIAELLLIGAVGAMVAALAASLWQRRVWLSGLRLSGARPARLRRIMALESTLMLGAGCLTGAIAGLYGQVVIDGYLQQVTGFPLASALTGARPLELLGLVLALALAAMAVPGWLISRVPPGLALEGER